MLSQKLTEIAELHLQLEELTNKLAVLENEAKAEVLKLGKSQDVSLDNGRKIRASYSKGRGKYDYVAFIKDTDFDPENANDKVLLEANSKVVVDYTALANDLGWKTLSDEQVKPYYTPGQPTVSFKLI